MDLNEAINQLPTGDLYLAPKNVLTELLETELLAIGIKISGFVDTFQQGDRILTASEVNKKTQAVVLVFSPRYKKDITCLLNVDHVFYADILDGAYRFTSVKSTYEKTKL